MAYIALILFFMLEYIRPGNFLPVLNVLRLNSIVPLLAVFLTIVGKSKVSNEEALAEGNTKIVGGLMALMLLSVMTADVTLYAYTMFMATIGYALIYWVIAKQVTDMPKIKGIFMVLVFVHIVVAALTPQMFSDPSSRSYRVAAGSFLGDGNDFALSVNVAIPFCLFLLLEETRYWRKILYLGALLFMVVAVVATQSRGGTIALACVALYYWLKSDRKLIMSAVGVVLVAVVLATAPPSYFERMDTISSHEDGSAQGRIYAWTAAVNMALDHPLLGVGSGHFAVAYGTKYRVMLDVPGQTAHSIYFLILGELGFPGLFLLLAFIFWNLKANRRLAKDIRQRPGESRTEANLLTALSASVIAFATGGAFLSAVYYPHLYMVAGLAAAGRRLVRQRESVAVGAMEKRDGPVVSLHPAMARPVGRGPLSRTS